LKQFFLLLIILISNTIASTNLVNVYRTQGIEAVEKLLNESLTKKSYWDSHLEKIDTSNGYYESIKYQLICNKNMKNIEVYDSTNNNKKVYSFEVITGEKYGDKLKEGDLKTPLGVFSFTKKLTKLDPFYGPLALVTSYPNAFDKSKGKTGSGIWVHGVPENEKRDPFTKGCIALDNKNLQELNSKINYKDSVLIIKDKNNLNLKQNDISNILTELFLWKKAWQESDLIKYLSFYSVEFKRANGTGLNIFKAYKKRVFSKNEKKHIVFSKINIIPYPNDLNKNMYKVTLFEKYKTKSYKFIGNKELYIEIKNDKIKILYEG
jgi:murein L,D-transpeptidase YafK